MHSSHSTWTNQRGPVPLMAIMMYFAGPGIPSKTPVLAATAVLKYPVIQWKTNRPMVPGTSSLRVRALNQVLPSYFSSA